MTWGKAAMTLLLVVAILGLVIFLITWLDPVKVEARQMNAPWWLWAWRGVIAAFGVGVSAALIGGGLYVIGCGIQKLVNAATIPAEHGVFPNVLWFGRYMLTAPNNVPQAQIAAAVCEHIERLPASVARNLLYPKPGDEMVPQIEAPPPLPARISIYSAPAPDVLALPIGHDGRMPIALPLRDLGSGIVGGLQGMGKSEVMASMIAGLLQQDASGQRIKIAVADLKGGVDFGRIPDDLAALQWPVAKSPEEGMALVQELWGEIERRQKLLDDAGVARIEVYNQRHTDKQIPYLVAFVDEIMMLSMAAKETGRSKEDRAQSAEFNGLSVRTIAVGRALGVSMIAATQRPSADVIPTSYRDICGMRLAFRCATGDASRAVLGTRGAELLPREPGRALLVYGDSQPTEVRTYHADIDGGAFDRFVKRQINGSTAAQLRPPDIPPAPATVPVAPRVWGAPTAPRAHLAADVDLPANPTQLSDLTPDMKRIIYAAYRRNGSVKGAERELWGQEGGVKFYLIRSVVDEVHAQQGRTRARVIEEE